uniref:Uncharacterized protein n=1 Tax=Glossina palpalis gambiensis TaxID=67801 RepID=A0A1B0BXL5_9MUSC
MELIFSLRKGSKYLCMGAMNGSIVSLFISLMDGLLCCMQFEKKHENRRLGPDGRGLYVLVAVESLSRSLFSKCIAAVVCNAVEDDVALAILLVRPKMPGVICGSRPLQLELYIRKVDLTTNKLLATVPLRPVVIRKPSTGHRVGRISIVENN